MGANNVKVPACLTKEVSILLSVASQNDLVLQKLTPDLFPLIFCYYRAKKMRGISIPSLVTFIFLIFDLDKPILKENPKWIKSLGNGVHSPDQVEQPPGTPGYFRFPYDVVVDHAGRVYVADRNAHRVQIFDDEGSLVKILGVKGEGIGQFKSPASITLDHQENVVVLDTELNRVTVFTPAPAWELKMTFKTNVDPPNAPRSICVDADGTFFISDSFNKIMMFWPTGKFSRCIPSCGPVGIAVDDEGHLLVVETTGRVQIFNIASGNSIRVIDTIRGKKLRSSDKHPWGLAIDGNRKIVVGDNGRCLISIFTWEGEFVMDLGDNESEHPGVLNKGVAYPRGLTIDPEGNILVADNHRIQYYG